MINKILLTVATLALATAAQARGHLTGDQSHYGLSVTQTVSVSGNASVTSQVGPLTFNGSNYGILAPTASSADAGGQVGVLTPFSPTSVMMSSTLAPADEQAVVAQLQAAANSASSGSGGWDTNGGVNEYYDTPQYINGCWQGSMDHGHFIAGCGCEIYQGNLICGTNLPSTNVPFENPYAGEKWWACDGVMLPPTLDQVKTQVSQYFSSPASYESIRSAMASFMAAKGIPAGVFQYKATVLYSDDLQQAVYQTGTDAYGYPTYGCDPSRIKQDNAAVTFSFFLDQTGQITTSTGKATGTNAVQFLYIKYFSKAMQPNVPPPVTQYYPYAGQLEYQMLDANMQPLNAMQYVDVGGAYDAADNGDPAIQAAVRCIASNANSGCNTSLPDSHTLSMGAGGNNTATIIDYAAQLDVDYSVVSVDSADGASSTNMMNWLLEETSRTLTYPSCGLAILQNQGNYKMLIDSKTNRYLVQDGASISMLNSVSGQMQTAATPFNAQVSQDPISEVAADESSVLDPTGNGLGLIPISEIQQKDIVAMAPLNVVGTPPPSTYYSLGDSICDVTNKQILTPQCPDGFTGSIDASGNAVCTGACGESSCAQPGTLSATSW